MDCFFKGFLKVDEDVEQLSLFIYFQSQVEVILKVYIIQFLIVMFFLQYLFYFICFKINVIMNILYLYMWEVFLWNNIREF